MVGIPPRFGTVHVMTLTHLLKTTLAATAAALTFVSPALAHEGAIGEEGPFRIEMLTEDPAGIESRWGNGEVEFHVEPGTEFIVIGLEKEPMVKVDAEGNMFANENSPSWWANQPSGEIPANATSTAEPNWVWQMGGGSLQFHDHRFHYMSNSVDPATVDGAVLFEFGLPVQVNGAEMELRGTMVFDSTLDPRTAEVLKEYTAAPETAEESSRNSILYIAGAAILVIAAAVVVVKKR